MNSNISVSVNVARRYFASANRTLLSLETPPPTSTKPVATSTPPELLTSPPGSQCSIQFAADPDNPDGLGIPISTECPLSSSMDPDQASELGVGISLGVISAAAIALIFFFRYRNRRRAAYQRLGNLHRHTTVDDNIGLDSFRLSRTAPDSPLPALNSLPPIKTTPDPTRNPPQVPANLGTGTRRSSEAQRSLLAGGSRQDTLITSPTHNSLELNPFVDPARSVPHESAVLCSPPQGIAMPTPIPARPSVLRIHSQAASMYSNETFLPDSRSATPPKALRAYRAYTPPNAGADTTFAYSAASSPPVDGPSSKPAWPPSNPRAWPLKPRPRPMSAMGWPTAGPLTTSSSLPPPAPAPPPTTSTDQAPDTLIAHGRSVSAPRAPFLSNSELWGADEAKSG